MRQHTRGAGVAALLAASITLPSCAWPVEARVPEEPAEIVAEFYPPGDPYGLDAIDVSSGARGIVPLPPSVAPVLRETFARYTRVVAPNGRPIHILAQSAWSDDQVVHARKVLEHLLTDAPGTAHGADKTPVANAMSERRATLVLFETLDAMEEALSGELGDLELGIQDLRANECPAPGSSDYMRHETRDASYEEILHLVHNYGIKPGAPEYDQGTQRNSDRAAEEGLWRAWPEEEPDSHRYEYIAAIYDNYLDLWTVSPTHYEGEKLDPGDVPEGTSHFGRYGAGSRARLRELDPEGYALVEAFFPPALTYTAELPVEFKGTFSIMFDGAKRYTTKTQHLRHVTLRGNRPCALVGNDHVNTLTGNDGDNVLEGRGSDDRLDGGDGRDTAVFRGAADEYELEATAGGILVRDGRADRDGVDTLISIEVLRFADGSHEIEKNVLDSEEDLVGGAVHRKPLHRVPADVRAVSDVLATQYAPFAKQLTSCGIILAAEGAVADDFLVQVGRVIAEVFAAAEGVDTAKQTEVLSHLHAYGALLPVPRSERSLERLFGRDESAWERLHAQHSVCDIIMEDVPDEQKVMEVVEHVLHTATDIGLHYAYPDEWGLSRNSALWHAMQRAIKQGFYDVSSYDRFRGERQDIFDRILMQEFAYWFITTAWDLQVPYGPNEDEWTLRTPEELRQKCPEFFAIYERTVSQVMRAPSPDSLDAIGPRRE